MYTEKCSVRHLEVPYLAALRESGDSVIGRQRVGNWGQVWVHQPRASVLCLRRIFLPLLLDWGKSRPDGKFPEMWKRRGGKGTMREKSRFASDRVQRRPSTDPRR